MPTLTLHKILIADAQISLLGVRLVPTADSRSIKAEGNLWPETDSHINVDYPSSTGELRYLHGITNQQENPIFSIFCDALSISSPQML